MKVILLVDDKKLGKKHSIIEVADSYARNVLIPKKIVEPATNENINKLNNQLAKEKYEYELKFAEAIALKNKIEELHEITIKVECKNGKMFGAVTSKDIVAELAKHDINIDKKDVILEKPIKELCATNVVFKLFGGVQATIGLFIED